MTGSKNAPISPVLFAGCHVLHRLLVPRHPPDALITLERLCAGINPPQTTLVSAKSFFLKFDCCSFWRLFQRSYPMDCSRAWPNFGLTFQTSFYCPDLRCQRARRMRCLYAGTTRPEGFLLRIGCPLCQCLLRITFFADDRLRTVLFDLFDLFAFRTVFSTHPFG